MRNAHPYYVTPKAEQHESARARIEREARAFLDRKRDFARRLAGRRLVAVS